MRAFEIFGRPATDPVLEVIEPKAFYHGSNVQLEPDTELRASGTPTPFRNREWFLEMMRPKSKLSRRTCIYMVGNPRDAERATQVKLSYIYQVEPGTRIEKSNLYWFDALSALDDMDMGDIQMYSEGHRFAAFRSYAERYWRGDPPTEPDVWEFRTEKATILDEV